MTNFWLMKAEPNSRIVKGKDVKFSVEDFEAVGITSWEGVRNPEARNLMKGMRVGDKVLFYHSSCKTPGPYMHMEILPIEAYPDYTAWDPKHPYYDPKSEEANPKWFMVDVKFISRASHFVPYRLLRQIAASNVTLPTGLEYLGEKDARVVKDMDLIRRGRLSVQRVQPEAWDVIKRMTEKGGWSEEVVKGEKDGEGRTTIVVGVGGKRKRENENETKTVNGERGRSRVKILNR
ncbi:PUA-like domain-containing protein [Multifurca ochricompacta]|uniref:PUA-like domain-containing protein n=1 Tax=Multifurca ochricompacta TaxID=376703 RepID=A0AAD4MBX3_9AGAM|nr:PUA-like domain-containing protein [Multifurca ochricompacta]